MVFMERNPQLTLTRIRKTTNGTARTFQTEPLKNRLIPQSRNTNPK